MQILHKIWRHPLYQDAYQRIVKAEVHREFCCHQLPHLLDVARIAYIRNLKEGLGLSEAMIYAAALLHDIGKARQYEEKIPHELAGEEIAARILTDIAEFTEDENEVLLTAILEHRRYNHQMTVMGRLLYESDKASRTCFACPAQQDCNWEEIQKNRQIEI